jgi:ribonuclease HI
MYWSFLVNHLRRPRQNLIRVHIDGAIRPEAGLSGLAVVARDTQGVILWTVTRAAGALTCNAAEYAAAVLALEELERRGVRRAIIFSDSQIVVDQMCGRASVRSPRLRELAARLRRLAAGFTQISFRHIPRERNRLADALAAELLEGWLPEAPNYSEGLQTGTPDEH